MLTLHTSEPRTCLVGRLPLSSLPPGVHFLGPHPQAPDDERYELVADDGRRLQHGTFPRALLAGKEPTFWGWRDELNDELLAHRCPECPVPAVLRRGRRHLTRLA